MPFSSKIGPSPLAKTQHSGNAQLCLLVILLSTFCFFSILATYIIAKRRTVSVSICRRTFVKMCSVQLNAVSTQHSE